MDVKMSTIKATIPPMKPVMVSITDATIPTTITTASIATHTNWTIYFHATQTTLLIQVLATQTHENQPQPEQLL